MLMFVFGAGASFDSDPERRPGNTDLGPFEKEHRPPLAAGLFNPDSETGKQVVARFPRASSLIMQLRQAVVRGLDVEEVLEQIASDDAYPNTAVQLLAFRGYLSHLLSEVPGEWLRECRGLTNYVPALEKANRWNLALHPDERDPIACVTFNYDLLLEDAIARVFGHRLTRDMNAYTSSPDVHLFKPHGSVDWRLPARWDLGPGQWRPGLQGLQMAIDQASTLDWDATDTWTNDIDEDTYQDPTDATRVWLPALSVPVRRKAGFSMPEWHMDTLTADLDRVTTLIAVGWRARELHFLQLMFDHLPLREGRLVVVAESDAAAQDTVDRLWPIGRFGSYAISGAGFSGFTESAAGPFAPDESYWGHTPLTLDHVLAADDDSGIWVERPSGDGDFREVDQDPFPRPGYVEL